MQDNGSKRETGVVKWFNDAKGYGFIARDNKAGEKDSDVFVHFSSVIADGFKTLAEGQRVEFSVAPGRKGLAAVNVRKI